MSALTDFLQPIQKLNIERWILQEDGNFPNNGLLSLLVYRAAFQQGGEKDADTVREILETNSWGNSWINGVYDYHHYHSTAHEILVGLTGSCSIQFGGPNGISVSLEPGDAVIIPAGVAHKRTDHASDFTCMGAYPGAQDFDMNYGKKGERPGTDENIRKVPVPENDPLYGSDGPLLKNWLSAADQNASQL